MGTFASRPIVLAAGLAAAAMLSGCSATTYGTGVNPGTQTMRDLANVIRLGNTNNNEEEIEIRPRAGIVAPPSTTLPPPGSPPANQTAANWPTDPEDIRRRMKAEADAARENGGTLAYDPGIRIDGPPPPSAAEEDECTGDPGCMYRRVAAARAEGGAKPNTARAGSVDETGAPVRRYLVEPPSEYRQPSPEAPVAVSEETREERNGGGLLRRLWPF